MERMLFFKISWCKLHMHMTKKLKYFQPSLVIYILLFLQSCQQDSKSDRIFFGGQIINPSSNYVTLYKDNKTIDSLPLNINYRFFKYYDSLETGIYKIEHFPEYQSVFLEKGDSIWARINASSFDESIVYSGHGAAKNNFMMDLYLRFEEENSFLSSKYSKEALLVWRVKKVCNFTPCFTYK